MAAVISVIPPYRIFADTDGVPLEDGFIYIGTKNLNPLIEANRIQVYSNSALTIPVAQPIRTSGGYPVASGTPIQLFVSAVDYAIAAVNKNGELVYSSLTNPSNLDAVYAATDAENTLLITPTNFSIPSHDVVGSVLPQRYGWTTASTGTVNYAALIQAAAVASLVKAEIVFPGGNFNYNPAGKINVETLWRGQGITGTAILVASAYNGETFRVTGHAGMRDMSIFMTAAAKTAGSIGVRLSDVATSSFTAYGHLQDMYIDGFEKGLDLQNVTITTLINIQIANCTYGEYCVPDSSGGQGYVTTIKHVNCNILQNTRNVFFNPSINSTEVSYEGGAIEASIGAFPQASFTNMTSLRFSEFYTEGNSAQPWLEMVSVGQFEINGMTNVSGGRITVGDNSTVGTIIGYVGQGANAQLVAGGTTNKISIEDSQFASAGNTFSALTSIKNTTINGTYYDNTSREMSSYRGSRANRYPISGTTGVAGAGATDVYRFLDIFGVVVNTFVSGTLYISCADNASGANSATYAIDITSNNNLIGDATLFPVRRQIRGTDCGVSATPFSLANDGVGGAVKIQFTKNAAIAQVNVSVVFIGLG